MATHPLEMVNHPEEDSIRTPPPHHQDVLWTWTGFFSVNKADKPTRLMVKNTEKIVNSSKKVTNSSQTTSSSRTTTTSDSKSSTSSNSSSHQNKKEQKPSSSASSRRPYLLWTWTGFFSALLCRCDRLRF
jgi:16S rRNA G1207 methylase RsmC